MLDLAYRVLSLLVQARFQLALVVAVSYAVFLLIDVGFALEHPVHWGETGALDVTLFLVIAVWLLAQLPPGVVFRPTHPTGTGAPALDEGTGEPWGCRISGWLRAGRSAEWRLLAPGTLHVSRWGGVEAVVPSFRPNPRATPLTPFGVRTLDWYRPFGVRLTPWGVDPRALRGWRRRLVRPPEPVVERTTRLAIPAYAQRTAMPGWQYAALRRYPAIRVAYTGEDGRVQYAYLAFGSPRGRDAVLAHLAAARPGAVAPPG